MPIEKSLRRLPLRELMTDAEKKTRDLAEHLSSTWITRMGDLRDLSRPVRRKSHYPTFLALLNALQKVLASSQDADQRIELLLEELDEIRDHARHERFNRN
jgi:hypothetical protein